MISTAILILTVLFVVGYLYRNRKNIYKTKPENENRHIHLGSTNPEVNTLLIGRAILFFVVGLLISIFQPYTLDFVETGYVGVKIRLAGDHRGISNYEYKTGWTPYNTWTEKLEKFPTYQQHIEYKRATVILKGGFETDIQPAFNYSLNSGAIGDMFQYLRVPVKQIEQGWLKNAIIGSVNAVSNRWEVDSIFNHRESFEAEIIKECNKHISKWFTVSQLRTNITPPDALKQSIMEKTKAIQAVQVAEKNKNVAIAKAHANVATAEGNARVQIAEARGDSASLVIRAAGKAEAIKREQMQLSPLYIEYIKINKWDGVNPNTILSSGASTIVSVK